MNVSPASSCGVRLGTRRLSLDPDSKRTYCPYSPLIGWGTMKIIRADSTNGGSVKLSLANLPPAMLQTAASRLVWIGLACAVTSVVMQLLQRALQPQVAAVQEQRIVLINTALVMIVS